MSETPMFEAALLEVLDFRPVCDEKGCPQPAVWELHFGCDCPRQTFLICDEHAAPTLRAYHRTGFCRVCKFTAVVRTFRTLRPFDGKTAS